MTAGSRSSPAITSAGSPGSNCCNPKISTDTRNSVGTSCSNRRGRNFSTCAVARSPAAVLQLQIGHADQTVGHHLESREPRGVREQQRAVIQVEHSTLRQYLG